jgi:hypothetical protein
MWTGARVITAWTLATGIGIIVSWLGVRAVLDAAVPDRFVALPAAEQQPPDRRPADPVTSASRSAGSIGARRTPSPSAAGRPSTQPSESASVPSTVPSTVDGWLPVGDGQFLRSFQLTGGDVVVRAGPGSVQLVSATPRPGYAMTILPRGSTRVVVDFATALQISTLSVTWQDGRPAAEVIELP